MKKTVVFRVAALLIFALSFVYCSSDNNNDSTSTQSPDVSKLLTNIYENGILKDFKQILVLVDKHKFTLEQFKANPSSENLLRAIEEDKELNTFWDGLEVYRLQLLRLVYRDVQHYPIDATSLLDRINAEDSIEDSFFDNLPDQFKGMLANSYMLNSFTAEDFRDEPKYTDFLLVNLFHIKNKIQTLENYWNEEGEAFVAATGTGIDQSVDLLLNVYINLLETINLIKLEEPLSNKSQALTESPYNDISIQLIQSNLKALRKSFNGNFENSFSNYGFDDYLKGIERADLSDFINTKIDEAYNASLSLNSFNNVVTNTPEEANFFTEKIIELFILFKVDISSAMNITVTFTDNDGD